MKVTVKRLLSTTAATAYLLASAAAHAGPNAVRIGLLMDMSGNYSDVAGAGSVEAAKMAVEDFGGKILGKPIEVVHADMQNKVDIATSIAREWFDVEDVDAILDANMSSAGLAVSEIALEKNRLMVMNISGSPRFTNENCNPNTVHYVYDTYALANSTGRAIVESGKKKWFFVTVDYTFGHDFQRETSDAVVAAGGEVVGSVLVPLNAPDYSSYLMQALASDADVVAFATAGADTSNAIKQAAEFGIGQGDGKTIAGLLVYINEIDALGLEVAQDMMLTSAFYWDMNDETRAFAERYEERMGKMPNMSQAGVYSSTMHYLKSMQAAGTDEAGPVMAKMKELRINDFFVKDGYIRADGRMMNPLHLFRVKTSDESTGRWDYYELIDTIAPEDSYTPPEKSRCGLLTKG